MIIRYSLSFQRPGCDWTKSTFFSLLVALLSALFLAGSATGQQPKSVSFTEVGTGLPGVAFSSTEWGDYNQDGDVDLFIAGRDTDGNQIARIYRSDGDGTFTDIEAGLTGVERATADWGDYDSDGDLDLIVTGNSTGDRSSSTTVLYRNEGNDSFASIDAGLPDVSGGSSEWGDFDGDGNLDLLLSGEPQGLGELAAVYKNQGDGSFTKLGAGLTDIDESAADWGNLDGDGDLDIAIIGESTDGSNKTATIYRNEGGGSFTAIGANLPGIEEGSVNWVDFDRDGDLDLALTGHNGGDKSLIYRNEGGGTFSQVDAGLIDVRTGSQDWRDYDGDGDPDLVQTGSSGGNATAAIYQNQDGSFMAIDAGLQGTEESSSGWGDYDGDGDMDLIVAGFDANGEPTTTLYENGGDATPPGIPENLIATSAGQQVDLTWSAVGGGSDPSGYNVYRSTSSFDDISNATKLNGSPVSNTSFTDTEVTNGTEYFYRGTAVDGDGNESAPSNEVSATPQPVDLNEGLVAYYPFNGSPSDQSGNGRDGTVEGDPQFVEGVSSQAIEFDGEDDFVEVPHSSEFNPKADKGFSVSLWAKATESNVSADRPAIIYKESGEHFRNGWAYRVSNNNDEVAFFANDLDDEQITSVTNSHSDGNWHHIVAVKYSSKDSTSVYFDGQFNDGSSELSCDGGSDCNGEWDGVTTERPLMIGTFDQVSGRFYKGRVDEVRIYDRVLNASEIQQLYNTGGESLGRVAGEVVDEQTGNAVDGATVSIQNRSVSATSGSDGAYSLFVEPGTGYTVTVGAEGYRSSQQSFVTVEAGETTTVDLSLQPLSGATPVVTTLTPNPNPSPSEVGSGGRAIRYYKIIDGQSGTPLPNLQVTVEGEGGSSYTYQSDQSGVVSISIPAGEVGSEGDSKTFQLTSVSGQTIPEAERQSFTVEVVSRTYTKRWALRSFGEVGLGVDFGFSNTGRVILRGTTGLGEPDAFEIQRRLRGEAGVSLGVSTPRVEVGETGLGAGASVGTSLFFYRGDGHAFDWQGSPTAKEAAARFYVWARSNLGALSSNNLIRGLTYVADNIVFDQELDESYQYDAFGLGNQTYGAASFQAGLGTLTEMSVGVKGGINGDFEAYLSSERQSADLLEVGASLDRGISGGVQGEIPPLAVSPSDDGPPDGGQGRQFRQQLADLDPEFTQLGGRADVSLRWLGELGVGCNQGDPQYLFLETGTEAKGSLAGGSYPSGAEGTSTNSRYQFEIDPDLEPAWEGDVGNATAHTMATSCGAEGALRFGQATFAGLIEAIGGQAGKATSDPALSYPPVPYSVDSTMTTSESSFDLVVSGALGIKGTVGAGGSFAERRQAMVEKGGWFAGRHYPTEQYDSLPAMSQSYKDVVQKLAQDLKVDWWDSALDIVDAIPNPFSGNKLATVQDSTYSYQIGDNGTTVVFDNEAVPPEVDSIQGVSWGWWGSSTNTTAQDLSPESRRLKSRIKKQAESLEGMRYGIGGFYRLKPLGTGLQALTEITIHYAEEELGDVEEGELAVYWENTEDGGWEYVGGTVAPDSNTVTAQIDTFRTFTLAPKLPSGSFELQPDTSSIGANGNDSTTVQSTLLTHNDGSTVEDGALYTVETTRGEILTPDADTARSGVQVPVSGGTISFVVQSNRVPGTAALEARSVQGQSSGEGSLQLENTGPPAPVTISSLEGGDQSVTLSWTEAPEPDLAGYKVYFGTDSTEMDGVAAEGRSSPIDVGESTETTIPGLPNDTTTFVAVSAYDAAGVESDPSVAAGVVPTDTLRPGVAKRVRLIPSGDSLAALLWTAPADNRDADASAATRAFEYRVRRAEGPVQDTTQWWETATPIDVSGSPSEPGTREQVFVPAPNSKGLYYGVRAVDEAGNVSPIRFAKQWTFVDSGQEVRFDSVGTRVDLSVSGGTGVVSVRKFDTPPNDTLGIAESTVSEYRFVIQAGEGLSIDSSEVRFAVSSLGGIGDPSTVEVYRRPTVGTGTFTQLPSSVDDGGTPGDITDDTLSVTSGDFSEFVLASNSEPLPVVLASFNATLEEQDAVRLSWTTTSETGNVSFRVQRTQGEETSADPWTTISSVEGSGTTTEVKSYRYVDKDLPYEADRLTYRLKQVDTDGSTSYSKELTVERSVKEIELLGTYPNPAQQRAAVRYAVPQRQEVKIYLYDILGRRVQTVVDGEREGRHKRQLDVSRLASGVYFLRLQAEGQTRTQKLTVVR